MELTLKVLSKEGKTLAEQTGENGICLIYDAQYNEGD